MPERGLCSGSVSKREHQQKQPGFHCSECKHFCVVCLRKTVQEKRKTEGYRERDRVEGRVKKERERE